MRVGSHNTETTLNVWAYAYAYQKRSRSHDRGPSSLEKWGNKKDSVSSLGFTGVILSLGQFWFPTDWDLLSSLGVQEDFQGLWKHSYDSGIHMTFTRLYSTDHNALL